MSFYPDMVASFWPAPLNGSGEMFSELPEQGFHKKKKHHAEA